MKVLLLCAVMFLGLANQPEHRKLVYLAPNDNAIRYEFGGKHLVVSSAPPVLYLPAVPPRLDSEGSPWSIEISNHGSERIMVVDRSQFVFRINPEEDATICSDGRAYKLKG